MKPRFEGQVVIVTGASSGIGKETARAFAAAGARVVEASRRSDPPCDVTRDADVRALVQRTLGQYGRIDILVNNAGVGLRAPVVDTPLADAQWVMDVNFFGPLRLIQAVVPVMRQQGRGQIVNVGSVLSLLVTPHNGVYCASKFALRALTDALRMELRGSGIDVILIMPGYTDTPFFEHQLRYGGPVYRSSLRGQHPSKVARAILEACARRRREVVLTLPGKIGAFTKRFAPRLLDWAVSRTS